MKHTLSVVNSKNIEIINKIKPSSQLPKTQQQQQQLKKQYNILNLNYEATMDLPTSQHIFNSSSKFKNTNPGNVTVIPNHSFTLTGVINELSIFTENNEIKQNTTKPVVIKKIIRRKVKKNKEDINANVTPPPPICDDDDDDELKPIPPELIRSKPIQDTTNSNVYSDTSDAEIPFYLNPKIEINDLPATATPKKDNITGNSAPKKREIVTSDEIGIIDDSTYNDEGSSLLIDTQQLHAINKSIKQQELQQSQQRKRKPIQTEPSPIKNELDDEDDVGIIDDPCFSDEEGDDGDEDNDVENDEENGDDDEEEEDENDGDDENVNNFIQKSSSDSSYDEAGNHIKTKRPKKRISKKYVDYKDQLTDTWWKRANNQLWSNDDDDTLLPYTDDDINNELNALNALRSAEINNMSNYNGGGGSNSNINNTQNKKTPVSTTITPSKIKRPTQTKSYSKTSRPVQ